MTFGLSLTGYLLPWDQKGYWATQVATNIAGNLPVHRRRASSKIVVGGPDYGNHTLTRFYALHVGILPPLLIVLLVVHIAALPPARRDRAAGTPRARAGSGPTRRSATWSSAWSSSASCCRWWSSAATATRSTPRPGEEPTGCIESWAKAGRKGWGANLDAPADRDTPDYPARPEWYFLFLFQLLKYFEGDQVLVGTVFIPNGVMVLLFLLPLLGIGRMRKFGHFFGIVVVVGLLAAVAMLTVLAFAEDSPEPLFGRDRQQGGA